MNPKASGALCDACPLLREPFVPSEIRQGGVLCVGTAPGADEVRGIRQEDGTYSKPAPFLGISGKLLVGAINNAGHVREDCSFTNVVSCRPPFNRDPTDDEIRCCRVRLLQEMQAADPNRILVLGKVARETLIPYYMDYRGWARKNVEGQPDIMVTWHPAYVYRKPGEMPAFQRDVDKLFEGPVISSVQQPPTALIPESYEELAQVLSTAPEGDWASYDLETNQIKWYDRPGKPANSILMMGIAWSTDAAVIIGDELLYDDPRTADLLNDFLPRMKTTGHNIKFDNIFLRQRLGIKNVATFDTMLAHGVLDENSKHGLKILAYEEFDMPDYEEALIKKYLGNRNDEYSKVPFDQLAKYCAWDCTTSHALRPIYQARLEKEGLMEWPYNRVLMPANEAFTVMTMRGLQVDIPYLKECHQYLLDEAERIRYKTGVMIGNSDINLNSPKQVAEVLWDFLKLPQFKSKRIKDRSTSEDAVMHLRGKHPFVDELQHYRRVAKFDSSYIQNMIEFADFDNRVHADVMLLGTEIGRLSMRDPAVQTIPRPTSKDDTLRDDYDPYMDGGLVRGAMVASPGCLLGIADYSQAELRVWGAMSHEPFLLQAYRDERDLHSEVALGMYGPNYTKEQRVMCKMFNFSYVYGGTERSFADSAGLPLSVAIEFVRNYNKLMPVAIQWKKDQFQLMRTQGYVETMFGRRRRFPLITPENQDDARKASVHQPVAGTASDLTTMAATRLILEHDIPVVLTVHDSILTDSPEALVEDHVNEIVAAMQDVGNQYISEVPWKVDKEIAYRWAEPPKLSRIVAASTSQERST